MVGDDAGQSVALLSSQELRKWLVTSELRELFEKDQIPQAAAQIVSMCGRKGAKEQHFIRDLRTALTNTFQTLSCQGKMALDVVKHLDCFPQTKAQTPDADRAVKRKAVVAVLECVHACTSSVTEDETAIAKALLTKWQN